jgi:hypothetical protein
VTIRADEKLLALTSKYQRSTLQFQYYCPKFDQKGSKIRRQVPAINRDPPFFMEKRSIFTMLKIKNRTVIIAASVFLVILSSIFPIFALDSQKTINQYGHIVWLKQNGLPANAVYVGFQGRDGYI